MTKSPSPWQMTFHFLGANHCGGHEEYGVCDYTLLTLTPVVAQRLLARMRTFAWLRAEFPLLCRLVEHDATPHFLSIGTVAALGLDSVDEWQWLTGRQARALRQRAYQEVKPSQPEGLCAQFDDASVFWSFIYHTPMS